MAPRTNDTSQIIDIIDLHPFEMNLVRLLRNVRFGRVVIVMRDGLPVRVERTTEFLSTTEGVDNQDA